MARCKTCQRRDCGGHTTRELDEFEQAVEFARRNGIRVNTRDHTKTPKSNELSAKAASAAWKWIKS